MRLVSCLAVCLGLLLSFEAAGGWRLPAPLRVTQGIYSLALQPDLGVDLRVDGRAVVRGNRILLRGPGKQPGYHIAAQSTPRVTVEEGDDLSTMLVSHQAPEEGFDYQVRITLSREGVFTYRLTGVTRGIENGNLQQDFMLVADLLAGAPFAAGGVSGQVQGKIPVEARPFERRWLVSTAMDRYTFRTPLGPVVAVAQGAKLVDFRGVSWLKHDRGILLYLSRPCKEGDRVETEVRLRLPPPRPRAGEPPPLSLADQDIRLVDMPGGSIVSSKTPGGEAMDKQRFWTMDSSRCFPHSLSDPQGSGDGIGISDPPPHPATLLRWVQHVPFLTSDKCVILRGWLDGEGRYPEAVTDLRVDRFADRLCFLHASSGPVESKTAAIRYVVHYEDESRETISVPDTGMAGLLARADNGLPRAVLAVTGNGTILSAYVYIWTNPTPTKRIARIDIRSTGGAYRTVVFAITGAIVDRQ